MRAGKFRLPNYFAEQPMFTLRRGAGLAEDDARGLLLLASYRLAATLERLTEDVDPELGPAGSWAVGFPVGRLRVQVTAKVIDPDAEPVPDRLIVSARDQEFQNLARQARTEVGGIRSRLGRLDAFVAALNDIAGGAE